MGYNYKIEYKKGRENRAADALSRRPHLVQSLAISTALPLWIQEVLDNYSSDAKCKELEEQLIITPLPPQTLH
jgi:hypothetical protein